MIKFHTVGGEVEIMHPKEIVNIVTLEKAYNTVQQYNISVPQQVQPAAPFSGYGSSSTLNTSAVYQRSVTTIEPYNDLEYFMLDSLVKEMFINNRVLVDESDSFNEAMHDVSVECLNNFGCPEHAIVLNPNIIIMGDFHNRDAICFKQTAPNQGALLMYQPNKFTAVYSKEKCPFFPVESKYGRFVSNVLLSKTMERLDLK